MNKRFILVLAFISLLFMAGCNPQKQNDPAIASVNGTNITQSEFDRHYNLIKNDYESKQGAVLDETKDKDIIDYIRDATYEDLVMQKLILQDADKQGVTVDPGEVEEILESFKQAKNSSGADGYTEFLNEVGITEENLKSQIEISQLYDKLQDKVTAGISITDADAQIYYNDNPTLFKDPGGIQIYHILVDTEQKAAEVMAKIKQGGDFAALAQEYSLDPGSKDQGGDVGLVNEDTNFVTEFKKAALTLQPGQLYPQAVKTDYGYHIIKAGDRQAASQMSFEQVKEQLKLKLAEEQKEQNFKNYLVQLQNSADIKDLRQQ